MKRCACWLALFGLLLARANGSLSAQMPSAKNSPKPEEKSPSGLSGEIRHRILTLPFYSVFDVISFTLDGSRVTLTGQVVRPTLKESAEAAVKTVEGVGAVVNQIEVLPVSPADDDLRRAVYRSLYEDPALARYAVQAVPSIHIIVKNGNVSLEGCVNSAADKNVAGLRASAVANVLSVRNNLVVQPK